MRAIIPVLLVTALALTGCQSGTASMPVPSGTPSPSATGIEGVADPDDLVPPAGATVVGKLGDPCSLLTRTEVAKALGVAVLAVVRGKVMSDGGQVCSFAMDAPGSTAAALGGFVGFLGPTDPGKVIDGLGTSGGVFGVVLQPADPSDAGGSGDDGGDDGGNPPGVTRTPVQLGGGGVVISTPNGGAAVVNDGIRTNILLMDLVAGPSDPAALQKLLTTAYNRL
ncbi:MAG: hypothetical protein ABIS08_00775 [Pseudolysinimonas sp.]